MILGFFCSAMLSAQTPIFVSVEGTGAGTSWSDACSLDSAMTLAQKEPSELWLKAGLYFLDTTLQVPDSTAVFGGFFGNETRLSERNYAQNRTVLDAQNAFAAVILGEGAMLNGLAVINGYAYLAPTPYGGGVWMKPNARVENCYVLDNRASDYGGGIYAEGNGWVYNTLFSGNNAGLDGLAIWGSTLDVRNVTVSENYRWGDPVTVDSNRCNILTPAWVILGKASFVTDSVWLVDTLLWSDAVSVNTCQKTAFDGGYITPPTFHSDCRSNPGYKGDLFSWCAVKKFEDLLCPKPWRVPSVEDFVALDLSFGGNGEDRMLAPPDLPLVNDYYVNSNVWGGTFAGACLSTGGIGVQQGEYAHYWSKTATDANNARHLYFDSKGQNSPQWSTGKNPGFSLRCVRNCPLVELTLATDASTRHQTICLNEPIAGVSHNWSGAITTIPTLSWDVVPDGVASHFGYGNIFFDGTPTTPGVYTWTIAAVGDSTCPPVISTGTITVNPLPTRVTVTTATNPACDSAILIASNGNDGTIYWQNTTADGTDMTFATDTQTVKNSGTYFFRARSDEGCWSSVWSWDAQMGITVQIDTTPVIFVQPDTTSKNVVAGNENFPNLTVQASGSEEFSYQWYSDKMRVNSGGTAIPGATSADFFPLASMVDTLYYYCIVGNTCGTAISEVSGGYHAFEFIEDSYGCNNIPPGWGNSFGIVSFATDSVWVVGNQVWSDAVTATNCNKTNYIGGDADFVYADCRSNPSQKGDLFSWCAVVRNQSLLCPAPWRVPTQSDYEVLFAVFGGVGNTMGLPPQITRNWGCIFGGYCDRVGQLSTQNTAAWYWSQTPLTTHSSSYTFNVNTSQILTNIGVGWETGQSLRCVRDTTLPPPPPLPATGCNNNTPGWGNSLGVVSFATDSVWTVGNQVWSDAVQTSVCSSRTTYYGGIDFSPRTDTMNYYADCRSNPEHPGDFFSWCAVMRFANMLCPAPWRVPTKDDFVNLDIALGGNGFSGNTSQMNETLYDKYFNLWGAHLGESVGRSGPHSSGYYWTSDDYDTGLSQFSSYPYGGAFLICHQHYSIDFLDYGIWNEKSDGFSLRCVRDVSP